MEDGRLTEMVTWRGRRLRVGDMNFILVGKALRTSICRSEHVEMLLFNRWLGACLWRAGKRETARIP